MTIQSSVKKTMTIKEVFSKQQPYFVELMMGMLKFNPNMRSSAYEML